MMFKEPTYNQNDCNNIPGKLHQPFDHERQTSMAYSVNGSSFPTISD
jgi:hypothetical protein